MIARALLSTFLLVLMTATAVADQRWQREDAVMSALDGRVPVLKGLALELPLVAEDGSSVNLAVKFTGSLEPGEYIHTVRLFAPGNPRPEVADYSLSAHATPVDIATRVRLSESQQVVALAITSQDRAFIATRDVRVTVSGCLVGTGEQAAMTMQNPRVAFAGQASKGQPLTVRTLINHPMETGLRPDGESADEVGQQLVESLTATLNGETVFSSRFYTGTSANPYVQFRITPEQAGELQLTWQDQNGDVVETRQPVQF